MLYNYRNFYGKQNIPYVNNIFDTLKFVGE